MIVVHFEQPVTGPCVTELRAEHDTPQARRTHERALARFDVVKHFPAYGLYANALTTRAYQLLV